jgi:large subunit ribosomal protein L22
MEATAKTKYLKGSPRKARLVIDLIRGVNVSRALSILKFTDKRAAQPIAKTLRSAIANATSLAEEQNIAIDPDDLFIKTCFVDMGPTKNRRRMRPAPQGRAYREQRHYCHITIQVSSDKPAVVEYEKKPRAAASASPKNPAAGKAAAPKSSKVEASADETPVQAANAGEPIHSSKETTASKAAADVTGQGDSEAADAKNVSVQQPEVLNETKPADEAQLNRNDELERQ